MIEIENGFSSLPRRLRRKLTRWSAIGSKGRKATLSDGLSAILLLAAGRHAHADDVSRSVDEPAWMMWLSKKGPGGDAGQERYRDVHMENCRVHAVVDDCRERRGVGSHRHH